MTTPSPSKPERRPLLIALLGAALLRAQTVHAAPALTLPFRDITFVHRWSKAGQHEFTPQDDADLKRWRDMLTLNVHAKASTGEALADVANGVLGNYQRAGKVLQTRSVPRSATQPAEHLIVAVLGQPGFLEASFARVRLHEQTGMVLVVSHRIYGEKVGPQMSTWLQANGAATEQALMAWKSWPTPAQLQKLPQSS